MIIFSEYSFGNECLDLLALKTILPLAGFLLKNGYVGLCKKK